MGHMVVGLMVGTDWIRMTQSKMVGSWIRQIGEVMDTSYILFWVLIGTLVIIAIILPGGVTVDTFKMSLRNTSHLFDEYLKNL